MIKPHLWPRIEFFSSGGQESWRRDSTTTFHLGGWSGILQDKVRMLGALVLCSLGEHVFCCALLMLRCACVNEWHALHEASEEPCSAVPWSSHVAYGRNLSRGLYQPANAKRHPMSPLGTNQKWAKRVDQTLLSRSNFFGLFDHFITPWELEVLT